MKLLRRRPYAIARRASLSARLLFCLILTVTTLAAWPAPARADGIAATHQEVAEQAMTLLEKNGSYPELVTLLRDNWDDVLYGVVWPDWVYVSQDISAFEEDAHDTHPFREDRTLTFRATMAASLAPDFGKVSHDAEYRRAIAFLFGIIAHQEADYPWHNVVNGVRGLEQQAVIEDLKRKVDEPMTEAERKLASDGRTEMELTADRISLMRYRHPHGDAISWDIPDPAWPAIKAAYVAHGHWPDGRCGFSWWGEGLECKLYDTQLHQRVAQAGMKTLYDTLNLQLLFDWEKLRVWGNKYRWTISNLTNYAGGGVADGAYHTLEAWKQAWNWFKGYVPPTSIELAPPQPDGNNGWYRHPVTVKLNPGDAPARWSVEQMRHSVGPFPTDGSTGNTRKYAFTGPFTAGLEGPNVITSSSVDLQGNVGDLQRVSVKIDQSPPEVRIDAGAARYTRLDSVGFAASDATSGLASVVINGDPLIQGQSAELFWLDLDAATVTVRAEDMAGWVNQKAATVELVATIESLEGAAARLCQDRHITKSEVCKDLSETLAAARRARDRGDYGTAVAVLKARIERVTAQRARSITERGARVLLMDLEYTARDLNRAPGTPLPPRF